MTAPKSCSVVPVPSPGDLLKHTYCSSEDLTVKTVETEGEMALSDCSSSISFHHDTDTHLSLVEHRDMSISGEFDAGLDIDGSESDGTEKPSMGLHGRIETSESGSSSDDAATIPTSARICVGPRETSVVRKSALTKTPTNSSFRPRSILKPETKAEPRYINNHRRSWRSLPQADLDSILQQVASQEANATTAPQHAHRRHSVGFDSIQIRFYSQTVGDNPSCSYGTPIQLDWDYEQCDGVAVDDFEINRGKRRDLRQMVLSYYHRRNILSWQYGFGEDELKQAQKQADKIKLKRTITRTFLPVMPFESVMEKATRRAKQLVKSK
ncbi:MAG: hypothetical protein SGILL_005004 [Bacillariaceae sp.]